MRWSGQEKEVSRRKPLPKTTLESFTIEYVANIIKFFQSLSQLETDGFN